jgi:hypothetical protein
MKPKCLLPPLQEPLTGNGSWYGKKSMNLGRKADHSPPTSAKVKKMWIYKSTPPYVFMA